ncbi:hypothetical protein HED54_20485 [Ochrobactrum anthropi ATCC 49188]|nr:hypothetical protein [Brucella anthropi ATCC 49188]
MRLNAAGIIDTNGFNGTFSGVIDNGDDPNYPGQLIKVGAGTLTLSGDSTYTGGPSSMVVLSRLVRTPILGPRRVRFRLTAARCS